VAENKLLNLKRSITGNAETPKLQQDDIQPWRVLVVDDEVDVHNVTQFILEDVKFEGRPLEILNAYSGQEARALLAVEKEIAIILLDVVMETNEAGLELVKFIREDLKNKKIRIILRTGQPGQAPEAKVVIDYDINDYKEKNELTAQKLFTAVIASLRAYKTIMLLNETIISLSKTREGLEKIISMANAVQYQKTFSFEQAATTDFLTGLNNRHEFLHLGMPLVKNAHSNPKISLALAMMSIDHFKQINDTYGFDSGDIVLKEISLSLKNRFLLGDVVGYFGGSEFFVIATQLDKSHAFKLFDQFRKILGNQIIMLRTGQPLKVTVSVGVTLCLRESLDDMITDSHFLLSQAKARGGNSVVVSDCVEMAD
jgi:diguanylate cyclase